MRLAAAPLGIKGLVALMLGPAQALLAPWRRVLRFVQLGQLGLFGLMVCHCVSCWPLCNADVIVV